MSPKTLPATFLEAFTNQEGQRFKGLVNFCLAEWVEGVQKQTCVHRQGPKIPTDSKSDGQVLMEEYNFIQKGHTKYVTANSRNFIYFRDH